MTVINEVMSATPEVVSLGNEVSAARELMQDLGVHSLPVVDDAGALAGIVSSLDLADLVDGSSPVTTVMSPDVHTVLPETEVAMAALFMRRFQINHLVVVADDGAITGIVSAWDLLDSLAATVRRQTVETVDVDAVSPGDELVMYRPGARTPLRCRIESVGGPKGVPPYVVVWDDDPQATQQSIGIERNRPLPLDGCER
ncbi:MAG: CBS domain-containing protein [Acidimicrobiales bacterium]